MNVPSFTISCTNERIWNVANLISFLAAHQNRHIQIHLTPEAICLQTIGLYEILDAFEFLRCDIYTENLLENHSKYNIIHPADDLWARRWLRVQPQIDTALHTWNKNRLFLIFYRRPTANRIGIAANLWTKHRHKSTMHFSWGSSQDELALYEFDKLAGYCLQSVKYAVDLVPHMPLQEYSDRNFSNVGGPSIPDGKPFEFNYQYNDDAGIEMYKHILIDLVSESHVLGKTFYPTEKTFRPMWLKKPFITFASRDYLDYLHQMGFLTFGDFWDETYDGYEARDRYLKIIDLIDDLASKSQVELEKMYLGMQKVLDHNYNLLVNQSFKTKIESIT